MQPEIDFRGDDRFDVIRRIAAGSGGVVYEAFDRARRTRVALKSILAGRPEAVLRLKNEFRSLQDIVHPNLLKLGELIQSGPRWFVTMELVDGVDFVRYVGASRLPTGDVPTLDLPPGATAPPSAATPSIGFDERRLRRAVAQLAAGLEALHERGKVHRDLKPANILVSRHGRVVILDFGLVTDEGSDEHVTLEGHVVGTPAYMAPEQGTGRGVTAAADWYSVGVILYQILTGRLPHEGEALDVLGDKRRLAPMRPDVLVAGLPRDLVELCVRLLAIDPSERPTGEAIRRSLGGGDGPIAPPTPVPSGRDTFVGREAELDALDAAFDDARGGGGAVTVVVEGESGIGKTALVDRFRRRLERERGALVLSSRCYQRENVLFAGVDGLIDALARHLLGQPAHRERAAALVPAHAGLLLQVFPALRRVGPFADLPVAARLPGPNELRKRVLMALRELFVRLSERQPLALVVDDVHWLGGDGLAALRAIVAPPESPALLLVVTARVAAGGASAAMVAGERRLPLGPLPDAAIRALAAALVGELAGARIDVDALAREAAGHPLHLGELVHDAALGGAGFGRTPSLQEAILARVDRCPDSAQRVLVAVAAFGAPVPIEVAADAAGLGRAALDEAAGRLRSARLLVASGSGGTHLEPDHDRVTLAVLGRLGAGARVAVHRKLALALERRQPHDLDGLVFHWSRAGEAGHAARLAILAGDEAIALVAFDRAVSHYRLALELLPPGEPEARTVRRKLGEALSYAMRGPEAAEVYLQAAQDASAATAIELRRRAVEQLLITGHFRAANRHLATLLDDIGMRLPRTQTRALLSLAVRRAAQRLGGMRFRLRDAADIPPRELAVIDVCFDAALGLGMWDPVRAAEFQARHLARCLRSGEPYRIARALSLEAGFRAAAGSRAQRSVEGLQSISERVSRTLGRGHGYTLGWAQVARGIFEFLAGRWKAARDTLRIAADLLREHPVHIPAAGSVHGFIVDTADIYQHAAMVFLGELDEVRRTLPALVRHALERNNIYLSTHFRTGIHVLPLLARGEVARARDEVDAAIAPWAGEPVHIPHFLDVQARAIIDLYCGDGAAAAARLLDAWPGFKRAFLFHVQYLRVNLIELRGRAALAAAAATRDPSERTRWLGDARRCGKRLASEGSRWAAPLGRVLVAGAGALAGDDRAALNLQAAAEGFLAADMPLHAAAARRRLGRVLGGDAGSLLAAEAELALRTAQVSEPARLGDLLVPGFVSLAG